MARLVCILLVFCSLASVRLPAGVKDTLASFFPADAGGWCPSDSLRIFEGSALYDLIDGGADIYLEYGFVRAGARHYGNPPGGEMSVEVYEMRDTLAAWGMYSFLAAGTGGRTAFGQEGVGGEDFVIFWKNRFVVSVTALTAEGRTGLGVLAGGVDRRIRPAGRRPDLAEALLQPEFANTDVYLVKGVLAFERQAVVGFADAFLADEGCSGIFEACRTFILRYRGERECDSAEIQAIRFLKGAGGYRELSITEEGRLLSDPRGALVHLARDRRYLLLTLGESEEKVRRTAAALARAATAHLSR
jgi:Family of unknown function (DUF6599)